LTLAVGSVALIVCPGAVIWCQKLASPKERAICRVARAGEGNQGVSLDGALPGASRRDRPSGRMPGAGASGRGGACAVALIQYSSTRQEDD
jgi:hypothetical protein